MVPSSVNRASTAKRLDLSADCLRSLPSPNMILEVEPEEVGDIVSLLSTDERNFLIRNNGDKVTIGSLEGKMIALYFADTWSPQSIQCRPFTLRLIEVYNELSSQDNNFEIIFVSEVNICKDTFDCHFLRMPWLAIPFSDTTVKKKLKEIFQVKRRTALVIIDANGKVLNTEGVQAVRGYGAESYPFTVEKISKLREEAEKAKKDQTLRSLLVSSSRDYLIANDGSKVSVSNLEGKTVALYFSCNFNYSCAARYKFVRVLAQIYRKLKEIGESFEVVLVSLEDDKYSYDETIENMPWLALPFNDKICDKLFCYFGLREREYKCSTGILIGSDGKTMDVDLIELIKKYGFEAWEAFPFSQEKLHELSESQTLESLLVSGDLDYVINGKKGLKVLVKELVGKTILLQFGHYWRDDHVDYLPKLIEEYHKIKNMDTNFEVVFIPEKYDKDDKYDYGEYLFNEMLFDIPWLALPFDDERSEFLNRRFKIHGEPSQLVAIGPTGRTITNDVMKLLMIHGADAYPFTEEKLKELEHRNKEMPESWPKKIRHHHLHKGSKHALLLIRCCLTYRCDGCQEIGHSWSYCCIKCNFDLHPKCALWWW